ncbi:hypothetical protein [Pararhizobium qamdonense]|uniref:hypothetical protein n=1 Tax=Pararhizobium qamdonense TaxID=3031126 RepID=UPI0023E29C14|nr:hypothetical protein [Pararhizobium qamdonense]
MTRDDPKTAPFPTPAIAKPNSQPESLDLDDVDLGHDGVQGDVVVSKGPASTFVSKNTPAGDDK